MWVKVCGIRDAETARRVAELGADAVGLNFYRKSPRCVDIKVAKEISNVLPAEVARVGVFVNHPIRDVESIATQCGLDLLQLHGDEPPSYVAELQRRLPQLKLIRAWRMDSDRLKGLQEFLTECRAWNCQLAGCLLDAHVTGVYGGSGKRVNWQAVARAYKQNDWPPLILAGGLDPENVARAIEITEPWGVDVASGVESKPGVKDLELVQRFVLAAKGRSYPISSSDTGEIPLDLNPELPNDDEP